MKQEELYRKDMAYRPPDEKESLLLEAAWGCSWSKCIFCKENKEKDFHIESQEDILAKIKTFSKNFPQKNRLFILGEDALVIGYVRLKEILTYIRKYLPWVDCVSMYARAEQVNRLSFDELTELKELNLRLLYIGIESGSDEVLEKCEKGENSAVLKQALWKLDSVGIEYSVSIILGLGGKELALEHVRKTAELLNVVHPKSIRVSSLVAIEGTELKRRIDAGEFKVLSPRGVLLEEQILLEYLTVDDCVYYADNISNYVPISGCLQKEKKFLLDELNQLTNIS